MTTAPPPDSFTVAVRTLCDFSARRGDLDRLYTPAPSARQGMAGHQRAAARRGPQYQAELSLQGTWRHLRVRGRADGYDPQAQRLDEVKTHRGTLATPEHQRALHRAQLRVYGHLLCEQLGLADICLALVYVDIDTQSETVIEEQVQRDVLRAEFEALCGAFADWAQAEGAHRQRRDQWLRAMRFAHQEFRDGQHLLARAVFDSLRKGRPLLAQAPTGIGKTAATVFAALKGMPDQSLDKVFYLTAKTSGRRPALDAVLALLAQEENDRGAAPSDAPPAARHLPVLRVLELVARDKACEYPEASCDGASCPLARGFYDRLPDARQQAVTHALLDAVQVRDIAQAHRVCPYYLSQELVRWSDLVVGDVNHWFDTSALLHALTQAEDWRVSLLVDEAHNLIERARELYSATLDECLLRRARQRAPRSVARALDRIGRHWRAQVGQPTAPWQLLGQPSAAMVGALQALVAAVTDLMAEQPGSVEPALRDLMFDCLRFVQAAERFGAHSLFDVTQVAPAAEAPRTRRPRTVLTLRNVVPAPFTGPRLALARSATLFSATLAPWHFVRDMLGLPADTRCLDVPAPFDPRHLSVRLVTSIPTRYHQRNAALRPIAAQVAAQYHAQPGNYLVFASSFAFLDALSATLAHHHPDIPQRSQRPAMSEAQRADFVAGFTVQARTVGFAVLGGVFGEGIDLPGERLIGAFIATLGLPPFDPVNEAIRARLEQAFGDGYGLAYLYPGLHKVVQAAGRVIRGEHDRGVVHLIDDRFAQPAVRRLLPAWWLIDGEPGCDPACNPACQPGQDDRSPATRSSSRSSASGSNGLPSTALRGPNSL